MKELSKNSYKGYKDLDKARKAHARNSANRRNSRKVKVIGFDLVFGTDDELIDAFSNAESKIGLLREMHEVYKKNTG